VCWGGELEFLELAAVGGDFLRKRARETSEAPACMLTLRLSSRRQCARWESAEEVVGAAVAVTEDRRVAVVGVVLGEDMDRAAAEGITDRRHGALSLAHLVCQLSRPINAGRRGRNATGQCALARP
jgi:hypothetical protein